MEANDLKQAYLDECDRNRNVSIGQLMQFHKMLLPQGKIIVNW
jgi:hypothetical protein